MAAVVVRRPDAIVHQAPALVDLSDLKHLDHTFHHTNLLRTRGTDALIATAQAAGVTRFVAESYASARCARSGGMVTLLARSERDHRFGDEFRRARESCRETETHLPGPKKDEP